MHYSSLFVYFIVLVNLSLSVANPKWNTIQHLDNDKQTNYGRTEVNIDQVVVSDQNPKVHNKYPIKSINIGNGYQNSNTIVTVNGDDRTVVSQDTNGLHTDGTSFVQTRNNGMDLFNVGYGSGNQNKIIVSNAAAQPGNTGSWHRQEGQPTQSSKIENELKRLHSISVQLQQIATQLIQEMNAIIAQQ